MQISYTKRFLKSYSVAPKNIQKATDKQMSFLLKNIRHPSLKTKKYDETNDIWQARVNDDWRFYFMIQDDVYFLIDVISHPK